MRRERIGLERELADEAGAEFVCFTYGIEIKSAPWVRRASIRCSVNRENTRRCTLWERRISPPGA